MQRRVSVRLHGGGADGTAGCCAASGGAVASPGYSAATAAPRRADPTVARQDRESKPKNWDMVKNYKNFKALQQQPEGVGRVLHQVPQSGYGWIWRCVCVDAGESAMLKEQVEASNWDLAKSDQCPVEAAHDISVKSRNVLLSLATGEEHAAVRRCRGCLA